ncbi:putative F420-0 ABC transporter ATP-binding protein [Cellulomonas sp. SLBN-39]|uniref:putative F420-0 ABC transporter ATP-binding protein n=1 Tax=Cellulomonas sp. SLBN-39 TaxID=2768446 RepID=UPI0011525C45|nr:putative F420-0 ABC transporter ATP-binding protein [Cellulomonas sp. SLBN-39]TQL04625.1 iron complex transport system ATP-binding protein [Cellulomonas sp. SLBN-39]
MELRIAGAGVRLGGRWVVDGIDATPPPGAITGVLGPNGAGKSTLLRLVAGLLPPGAGAVLVSDPDAPAPAAGAPTTPVHLLPRRRRAQHVALLEQESAAAVPLGVREVVALGRTPYRSLWGTDPDAGAVDRALSAARADHLADRAWSTLSGGERQRVHVARALAQEPSLLLLDEPTNHLDVSAQLALLQLVHDLGVTTVAALHDLNLAAAHCAHVLVLDRGRLAAAGPPEQVLTPALLRTVYGVEADVLTHPRTGRPVIALSGLAPDGPDRPDGPPPDPDDGATVGTRTPGTGRDEEDA